MAVGVGFEPTEPFRVHFFSKEAHSTTLPPNHLWACEVQAKAGIVLHRREIVKRLEG